MSARKRQWWLSAGAMVWAACGARSGLREDLVRADVATVDARDTGFVRDVPAAGMCDWPDVGPAQRVTDSSTHKWLTTAVSDDRGVLIGWGTDGSLSEGYEAHTQRLGYLGERIGPASAPLPDVSASGAGGGPLLWVASGAALVWTSAPDCTIERLSSDGAPLGASRAIGSGCTDLRTRASGYSLLESTLSGAVLWDLRLLDANASDARVFRGAVGPMADRLPLDSAARPDETFAYVWRDARARTGCFTMRVFAADGTPGSSLSQCIDREFSSASLVGTDVGYLLALRPVDGSPIALYTVDPALAAATPVVYAGTPVHASVAPALAFDGGDVLMTWFAPSPSGSPQWMFASLSPRGEVRHDARTMHTFARASNPRVVATPSGAVLLAQALDEGDTFTQIWSLGLTCLR